MKQDALAAELGISQQAISKIEQSETVEEEILKRVAKVLGVQSMLLRILVRKVFFITLITLMTTVQVLIITAHLIL